MVTGIEPGHCSVGTLAARPHQSEKQKMTAENTLPLQQVMQMAFDDQGHARALLGQVRRSIQESTKNQQESQVTLFFSEPWSMTGTTAVTKSLQVQLA